MNLTSLQVLLAVLVGWWPIFLNAERVEIAERGGAWQVLVEGEPFFIKGFTWSHCPVGKKYDYDLFAEEEATIQAALQRDLPLMKEAGANTLRHIVPEEWMGKIHERFGFYFIANDYCGRYGVTLDGKFIAHPDYSDPKTRELIKARWRELATRYRDAPGLLLHALGNENNYGLQWESEAVANLPQDEQQREKAKHLYSLFNEIAVEVKAIDPDHPVGIVNGDLQYLDLIAELCPDIDYLGVNVYRGRSYRDLFKRVKETLGKPVLFMETGCDAYNAVTHQEDELAQARMIHANWDEIYQHSGTRKGEGNCLGAMVFQWADEWWKTGQQINLHQHDRTATWYNAEYRFDAAADPNMNEEWFGVCAIYPEVVDGAHLIRPRAAYYTLREIWQANPNGYSKEGGDFPSFSPEKMMEQSQRAAKELEARRVKAAIPFERPKKLPLPAMVYTEGGEETPWAPSGFMPAENFLALDPSCRIQPHEGETCLALSYRSGGDWSGLVWQNPPGDWDNDQPGGYDLSGATVFRFWARGEVGGEKLTVSMGGPLTGLYPNTFEAELGEITLTKEWQVYEKSLEGMDLRRIKNPLTLVFKGNGFPYRVFLDDIGFE
ncbi:MAG: glycoside hydrolase family 2 TIM barrel-domain containing protein [Verrucomicrobiota bacterium JB023]|nr:glycoside hydrolase family 2 TIM barrel-domain containing protein [Verrucomicrobiota bacterium JB023]